MEHKILIYYKNAYAHYRVMEETEGIYSADLLSYEGSQDAAPCSSFTIIKGVHRWWGCDDKELLILMENAISRAIDSYIVYPEQNPFSDK
jgi:hypothetical protein